MAKPSSFPNIPSLHQETQLYSQRRSLAEALTDYKFTINDLYLFLVSEYGIGPLPTNTRYYQLFQNQQSGALLWTQNAGNFPSNSKASFYVFQNGKKLIEDLDYTLTPNTGPSEGTVNLTSHINGTTYECIAI